MAPIEKHSFFYSEIKTLGFMLSSVSNSVQKFQTEQKA